MQLTRSLKACAILIVVSVLPSVVSAVTADELRSKIDTRSNDIKKLEAEIKGYQTELEKTGKEVTTLKGTVQTLDTTVKKLSSSIKLTENNISVSLERIDELSGSILTKEQHIERSRRALAGIVRSFDEQGTQTPLELALAQRGLTGFWVDVDALSTMSDELETHVAELRVARAELEKTKVSEEREKEHLEGLQKDLSDQKSATEYTKKEKQQLLTVTQSKESNYKVLLAERIARKEAFERELAEYESQLRIVLDVGALPTSGSRSLLWPTTGRIVTQEFGDTAFARANSSVYSGRGHNGIDIGVPIGSPIFAAREGRVVGTGDTDLACRYASYGRWVLIEHNNGLSTLYAHLSVIRVSAGQVVAGGETIGLSGNTGYSTGPHLHFTVFATQGVEVQTLPSRGCSGQSYVLPVAPYNAYLNPREHL